MSDPNAQGAAEPSAPANPAPTEPAADAHPGRITVTMGARPPGTTSETAGSGPSEATTDTGPETARPRPSPPPATDAPAAAPGTPPPQRPPGLQALLALHAEVREMRGVIDALAARGSGADTGGDGGTTASPPSDTAASLADLTEAVRTLEAYVSLTFFERVHTTLQEAAESDPRPAALARSLARLRRLVWVVGGVQVLGLIILGLMIAGSPGIADGRPAWAPVVNMLGHGADTTGPPESPSPASPPTGRAGGS